MAKDSSPKKLFRIGEVSQLTGINPHILRYWESEFQILAPNRRLSKQRLYRQADIDLILTIKRLLEDEKYTLSGVKQYLVEHTADAGPPFPPAPAREETEDRGPGTVGQLKAANPEAVLRLVRDELRALLEILNGKDQG
jgi:DNA-binding transcriptional MerR regulator